LMHYVLRPSSASKVQNWGLYLPSVIVPDEIDFASVWNANFPL
jgi:hypothetical protein